MEYIKEVTENKTKYIDIGTLFVLCDEETIIAVCIVTEEKDDTLEIKNLAIFPKYQGKGYGKKGSVF